MKRTWLVTLGALALVASCAPSGTSPTAASSQDTPPGSPPAAAEPAPPTSRDTDATKSPTVKRKRSGSAAGAATYAVLEVVDGDTVKVGYRGGESVRIIGIDTPETVSPSVPDECGGAAASQAAEGLLGGKHVRLVFDPTQGRRDTYDRLLAYVHTPGVGDFGLAMIRRGHAAEYTYDTAYRRQATYQRAEQRARAADKGLWGGCGGTDVPLHDPAPQTEPGSPPGDCAPGYDPCVPPYPPDVDCADVDGPVTVSGSDPHGLDADGDGRACES